jgi:enediyne biosynthesis protein CalE5
VPSDATAGHVKQRQTKHWNAVAGGWADWFGWTERNFRPVTDWLRRAAGWKPGARILDIACGAGYPALAAAASVRPGGTVVATDISTEMLAAASRRAAAAGLSNVEFREMDAEQLQFADDSFDSVTNAYGLMFCPEPQRAVREMYRVLQPAGRVAVVTWDELSKSPFFALVGELAASFLALSPPDPEAPGPFRLAESGTLKSLLRTSGFSDVSVESLSMTLECASIAEYLQIFTDLAWKSRIASLSDADARRFRDAVLQVAEPFLQNGRLRLVATSLCASGRKAL